MTDYLTLEDLLVVADAAIGGQAEIRDIGILEAAAGRPRAVVFGADAYPSLDEKAAALLHSIVAGHPLVDGNKRLGWVALRVFYRLNDMDVHPIGSQAFELVMSIADGTLRDVKAIAERLRAWRGVTYK